MRRIIAILTLLGLTATALGAPYADLTITVDGDKAVIQGATNADLPTGETTTYTDDDTFTFTTNQSFSDYILRIRFPQTTDITSIKTSGTQRISSENGYIVVTTVGTGEPIHVEITYDEGEQTSWGAFVIITAFILALLGGAYYITNRGDEVALPDDITDRQRRIAEYVAANTGVTQQDIADDLNIPKSSVSRNVQSLSDKNVINKADEGNANTITIND